jgi:hypothetical protein
MDDLQKSSTMSADEGAAAPCIGSELGAGRSQRRWVITLLWATPSDGELVIGFDIRVAAIALLTTSSTAPLHSNPYQTAIVSSPRSVATEAATIQSSVYARKC